MAATKKQRAAEHIINRLPYQLGLHLIHRIFANNGFGNLQNLLLAVPQLSKYVILIVDHPGDPYRFIPLRKVNTLTVSSLLPHPIQEVIYRLSDVLVISSFLYCEEYSSIDPKNVLHRYYYGMYDLAVRLSMHVFALVFDSGSSGACFLRGATKIPSKLHFSFTKQAPKGWIHFLKTGNNALCEGRLSIDRKRFFFPKGTFRKLISRLPGIHLNHRPFLTTLSITTAKPGGFICREDFPFVKTAKINLHSRCGLTVYNGACEGTELLFRAPQVNSLSISYTGCLPPWFMRPSKSFRELASRNEPHNAVFQMQNNHWQTNVGFSPYSMPSCQNDKDPIGPTYRDLRQGYYRYTMTFVRRFHTVVLKGIPANVLAAMDLSEARNLFWMRFIDYKRPPPFPDHIHILKLPNLKQLTLHSVVRRQWDSSLAPRVLLDAPNLTEINLIARHFSTEVWHLRSLFVRKQVFIKGRLCLLLAACLPTRIKPPELKGTKSLQAKHLKYVAADLKSLMVSDYAPMFLFDAGITFQSLERLSVDVSGLLPRLCRSKRTLPIVLSANRFPMLKVLTLTLSMGLRSSSNIQFIDLRLPNTVKELHLVRFLADSLDILEIDGVDITSSVRALPPPSWLAGDHYKAVSWRRKSPREPFARDANFSEPEIWSHCVKLVKCV